MTIGNVLKLDLDYRKSREDFSLTPRIHDKDYWALPCKCGICNKFMTPYDTEQKNWFKLPGEQFDLILCHETCKRTYKIKGCKICRQIITPYTPLNSTYTQGCVHQIRPLYKGLICEE
jgi:hypothetical protein